MPKLISRSLAFLLLPSLIADPSLACAGIPSRTVSLAPAPFFADEALSIPDRFVRSASDIFGKPDKLRSEIFRELTGHTAKIYARIPIPNTAALLGWGRGLLGMTPDPEGGAILPAGGSSGSRPPVPPSPAFITDLAKKGFGAVQKKDFLNARLLFSEAADHYAAMLEAMYRRPLTPHLSRFDFQKWGELTGTGSAFEWEHIRNLEMRIRSAAEFKQILVASLCLVSDYDRLSGPDISRMAPALYGPIENIAAVGAQGFKTMKRIVNNPGNPTASDTYEAIHEPGGEAYILKFMEPDRLFLEVLGQHWMRRLGFSVVDTRVIKVKGRPAVVMKKMPQVVTLYDYIHAQLFDPNLFDTKTVEAKLFPDGFRSLLEEAKLAAVAIELKDAHLRNVLLFVDSSGSLLPSPPLFIDQERSFGYRTNSTTGSGLDYRPYRGRFTRKELESGGETNSIHGEPYWHRGLPLERMRGIARKIETLSADDIVRIIESARHEMGDFAPDPQDFSTPVLSRKLLEAVNSVRSIFGDLEPVARAPARASAESGPLLAEGSAGRELSVPERLFKTWLRGPGDRDSMIYEARRHGYAGASITRFNEEPFAGSIGTGLEPPLAGYLNNLWGIYANGAGENVKQHAGGEGVYLWRETAMGYEFFIFDWGTGVIDSRGRPVTEFRDIFNQGKSYPKGVHGPGGTVHKGGAGQGMTFTAVDSYLTRVVSVNEGRIHIVDKEPGFYTFADKSIPAHQTDVTLPASLTLAHGVLVHGFVPIVRAPYRGHFSAPSIHDPLGTVVTEEGQNVNRGPWQRPPAAGLEALKSGDRVNLLCDQSDSYFPASVVEQRVVSIGHPEFMPQPPRHNFHYLLTLDGQLIALEDVRSYQLEGETGWRKELEILGKLPPGTPVLIRSMTKQLSARLFERQGILREVPGPANQGVFVFEDGFVVGIDRVKEIVAKGPGWVRTASLLLGAALVRNLFPLYGSPPENSMVSRPGYAETRSVKRGAGAGLGRRISAAA